MLHTILFRLWLLILCNLLAVLVSGVVALHFAADPVLSDAVLAIVAWPCGLVMLFSLLISYYVLRHECQRFNKIRQVMHSIAFENGDLSQQLCITGADEAADLTQALNAMLKKFSQHITDISLALSQVSGAQARTTDVTNSSMDTIVQLQDQLTLTATAIEEMSATAQEVSRNIVETSQAANQAKIETEKGNVVLQQVLQDIIRVSNNVAEVNQVVNSVSQDSNAVGETVNVINSIAEQTNLLALNAAIEAARAGEQGRGFAVVADEVRQLASRTQESTKQIQQTIQQLQDGMNKAVRLIHENSELAQQTSQKTTAASEALEHIATAIHQIHDMATQVATASEQQSITTQDTNEKVHLINQYSNSVTNNSQQIIENTQSVSDSLNHLVQTAYQFKVSDAIGLDLALAKSAHLAWRSRIRNMLAGKVQINKHELTDHTLCILGKWYYAQGQQKLGDNEFFKKLEAPHKEMHALVFSAVDAISKRQFDKGRELNERISTLSFQIVELIEKMEHSYAKSMC